PPAQEVAEHRVDEPLRRGTPDTRGRSHRAVHDGVRWRVGVNELVERDPDERFDPLVGRRAMSERTKEGAQLPKEPKRAVCQLVNEGTIAAAVGSVGAERLVEGRAVED